MAGMFGLELDAVPNFITLECGYFKGIEDFVRPLSLRKVDLAGGGLVAETDVGRLCILRGKSPRGSHAHVVVARLRTDRSFEFVHDPHPDDTFLCCSEPYGWCMFFAK